MPFFEPEIEIVDSFPSYGYTGEEIAINPSENGEPIIIYTDPNDIPKDKEELISIHDPEQLEELIVSELPHEHSGDIIVGDPEIDFKIGDLPGVDELDPELEEELLRVNDPAPESLKADDNDAKKSKKAPKWDWESKGLKGFTTWIKERLDDVPTHSGYDQSGLERAISYMEKLDSEISKAMRLDLDGELNADIIEEVRAKIEEGIERLHDRIGKISKKNKKKKKADLNPSLVKEGQKATRIDGIVITVPLLISRIAKVCVNSTISAGHDISDTFKKQCDLWKLTDREKAETVELLSNMGFPIREERGYLVGETVDPTSSENFDWAQNWQA